MALRFALRSITKHQGVTSTSLISGSSRAQFHTSSVSYIYSKSAGERHISTSGPLGLASTSKYQAPLAPAAVQESVDPPPYPYHPTVRDRRYLSPRNTRTPRRPTIPEQVTETVPEVEEKVNIEPSSSHGEHELAYWKKIPKWRDVTHEEFLRYSWQVRWSPKVFYYQFKITY